MPSKTILPKLSEREFTDQVIQLAKLRGWRVAHFRPGRTKDGWKTAVQGDGAGFVDLVLVRDSVIWAELKTDRGKVSLEQLAWLDALRACGETVRVWRPSDWPEIEKELL